MIVNVQDVHSYMVHGGRTMSLLLVTWALYDVYNIRQLGYSYFCVLGNGTCEVGGVRR